MRARSAEPFVWLLFSAGGVFAALFVPILLFLFGLAFPLEWISPPEYGHVLDVLGHPVVRVGLWVLLFLALFHWAHRFRYTLYDGLQLKHLSVPIAVVCYGAAVIGSVVAVYLFWQIP
jgi:fumarate reductase subunit D